MTVDLISTFEHTCFYCAIFFTDSKSYPFYFRVEDGEASAELKVSFDKYGNPNPDDHKLYSYILDQNKLLNLYKAFKANLSSLSVVEQSLDEEGRLLYSYKPRA